MSTTSSEPSDPAHKALGALLAHAHPRSAAEQKTLLMGMADLYEGQDHSALAPLTEVFVQLVRQAERDIRQGLAERLSHADWAPKALVQMLATDEIEIAQSLITTSPLLRDDDLITLLEEASLDHQIQVAQRPHLGPRPVAHIVHQGRPAVLIALSGNTTAQINENSLSGMVEAARLVTALRAPLVRHPQLNKALARKLYPWLGEALRREIAARFDVDSASLAMAMALASTEASGIGLSLEDQGAERLIQKLYQADQLRPAYLVRAAREERLSLFIHGLATLGQFPIDQVRHALMAKSARPLFLATAAVGVDRAVFTSLLISIQAANQGYPLDPDHSGSKLAPRSRAQADQEFRSLMNSLNPSSV